MTPNRPVVVALSGGVGGAKLVQGLAGVMDPEQLVVIANTGDDFEHLGYAICPDIDSLIYTLAGVNDPDTGWGRNDETWTFMQKLRKRQPEDAWFALGDKDLDTHQYRTRALRDGAALSEVTAALARKFGLSSRILPMSDDPVRTHLLTEVDGNLRWMGFQEYFVRERHAPRLRRIEFRGASAARPSAEIRRLLREEAILAVIVCPSNPYLSIDPILAVPGMADLLRHCGAPVVAVSPVVGGKSLKGPTAKIMRELDIHCDVMAIARHYDTLANGLVIDRRDRDALSELENAGLRSMATNTVMRSPYDRRQLARDVLAFSCSIADREAHVGRRTG